MKLAQVGATPQQIIASQLANEGALAAHVLRHDTDFIVKNVKVEDSAVDGPTATEVGAAPRIKVEDILNVEAIRVSSEAEVNADVAAAQEAVVMETQHDQEERAPPAPLSVLHPNTPKLAPLNADVEFSVESTIELFKEYTEFFPQHGKAEPGQHYRIESNNPASQIGNRERGSVLIVCVFNDAESWGFNRSLDDFFDLIESFEYPAEKISVALLTSSMDEFVKTKQLSQQNINRFARFSVIFRNDFAQDGLTRENRHAASLQGTRRRMIARYRNFALLSTLESWHQHVVWLDADVDVIPAGLLLKMTQSGLDVLEPLCARKYSNEADNWYEYDLNAWVGQRKVRPAASASDFIPGPVNVKYMSNLRDGEKSIVPLDSVGGTMLYVRADVHRQGVLFPAHYVIGSEWGAEGYDGIETEGLCYSAHFLGYKCWGMPNDIIFHATY
ncbi:hypothetical protein PHYBOEH_006820 [Phytophthora boehmeriae]|uniref:Uncharacterized protein n=1 Tax=Phytophthora boehmeriae TaxID=109152 RepID=A0A8T1WFK3_9STRA|nr:hypothetical protein PHYBOEH_006820 [Phytophthora boehmeriae]